MNKNTTDEYMKHLTNKYSDIIQFDKGCKSKIKDCDLKIPTLQNHGDLLKFNYTLSQLKVFAKYYGLKIGGDKQDLLLRIYSHIHLSQYATNIQKLMRGNVQRLYNRLHGPAHKKRSLCTNDCDFITMEPFDKIHFHQFISYMDEDGFIYGFEIASIYNLFLKNGYDTTKVKNPYNRNFIPHTLYETINRLVKLSFVLKMDISLCIEDNSESISPVKEVELRALGLFQRIDALGNYSDPNWFLSLNSGQLVRFMRHLADIFNYRAQLTNEVKRNIFPPNGNPFWNFNMVYIQTEENMNNIKNSILEVLENFVMRGIDEDSKSLGAYYVLAALTLVNDSAATALPWLFQSVTLF